MQRLCPFLFKLFVYVRKLVSDFKEKWTWKGDNYLERHSSVNIALLNMTKVNSLVLLHSPFNSMTYECIRPISDQKRTQL